jgi:tetratricopeptide (TPR) repeat protein
MKRIAILMTVFVAAGIASAQDEVYERGKEKPHKGAITKESAKGVALKDGTFIAAEKIEDVVYEVNPLKIRIATYRPAVTAEKESLDPTKDAKRQANIAEAIKKYQESIAVVAEAPAKRHAEFKIAALFARQALEDGEPTEPAVEALKKFKAKHPDSWQLGATLQLLGKLQLDAKDYQGARDTYAELSQAPVPADVKQDAQLQVVQVKLKAGETAEAEQLLNKLIAALPKDSKHAQRARVVQAELLVANKKVDEGMKILRQVTKETADRNLKALAYNTLGACLFDRQDYKGARWEFLWVDVIYNQDKNEHAKALYYLSKIFAELGDAERAQECREILLHDRAFAGSDWRTRAQKETQ